MNNLIEAPEVPQATVKDLIKAWLDGYLLKYRNSSLFDNTEDHIPSINQYQINEGYWKVYKKGEWWESKDLKFPFLAKVDSKNQQIVTVFKKENDLFLTSDINEFHEGKCLIPLTDEVS